MQMMKKWQEPLFAIGGFGTSFMYTVQSTYLLTRYLPAETDISAGRAVLLVVPWILSMLLFISRMLDGVVDIPIASWTDRMFRKTGKRYPAILIGMGPMILSYIAMWIAPVANVQSIWNIVWVCGLSLVYFFSYTLVAVPYLSSLSDMVPDQRSRVRVASWQAFFNTIGYSLAYTVVPLLRDILSPATGADRLQVGMTKTALYLSPVMLLMLIPVFLVFRKNSVGATGTPPQNDEVKMTMWNSLKTAAKNKAFLWYLLSYSLSFFGLMLFIGGMDYINRVVLGLEAGWKIAVMNAAAFAPIPLMLWLFNKINRKWGVKWAFRTGLLCFIVAMAIFASGWTKFVGTTMPFYIGMIAGTFGSFAIGAFFTVPYAIPSQIAAEEAQKTGINRSGMYFAVQGFVNQLVGALAGSVILANLVSPSFMGFGMFDTGAIFIMPIVIVACIVSYIFAGKLPGYSKKAKAAASADGSVQA